MPLEPWMSGTAPAQILLHDAVHDVGVLPFQRESCREGKVLPVVEDGIIVPESHIVTIHRPALALFRQQLGRLEYLGDEHGTVAFGGGREKVEVLPDGTTNSARDADVMFKPGPPAPNGFGNDFRHHGAALDPESPVVTECEM